MPAVSIITMCHNYGQYLTECLDSVFAQSFIDFESIVINAGSSDNTSEVAKRYPSHLLEIDDLGLSSSRNVGLMRAKGEYIVNLDADDRLHPQFLAKLITKAGPKKLVCPGLQEFGESTNSGWPNSQWGPGWGLSYQHFQLANRIFCCSMYPRQAAIEVGGYDPNLDWLGMEDWCLWADLIQTGCTVEIVPELLFYHRRHISSNSRRWSETSSPQGREYVRKKHADDKRAN